MAKDNKTFSDLFSPPAGLQGIHALMCAYSADTGFFEQALDKFTSVSPQSRLARGSIDATLLLDPDHQVFEAQIIPGLCQLHPRPPETRPWQFKKMHAKVALLSFGRCRAGAAEHFRLIVSTGNWTEASAKNLIEMAWYIDIPWDSDEAADLRDLHACATFFKQLLPCYHNEPPLGDRAMKQLNCALSRGIAAGPRTLTRFSSSLPVTGTDTAQPLLSRFETASQVEANDRNFMVCGSGFYEDDIGTDIAPRVLGMLTSNLRRSGLLTKEPETMVIANPDFGGQVARHFKNAAETTYALYRPKDTVAGDRSARTRLHAKFIYIGRLRDENLSSGLLYIGSGNLSFPGFIQSPRHAGSKTADPANIGNIETGVFIQTNNTGDSTENMDTRGKLCRFLPVGSRLKQEDVELQGHADPGEEFHPAAKPCPPILAFTIGSGNSLFPHWALELPVDTAVELDVPGQGPRTIAAGTASLPLSDAIPFQWLSIRANGFDWRIPCFSANAEYPRCALRQPTFSTWLDALMDFPGSWNDPAEDEPETGDEGYIGGESPPAHPGAGIAATADRNFPAHTAMLLVECIAQQNGAVPEYYRTDYLAHLRIALINDIPKELVSSWKLLRVNFLAPLTAKDGFAPAWKDLGQYEQLVNDVIANWGLAPYPGLKA